MKSRPKQPFHVTEPLPGDFPQALRDLDARLANHVRHVAAPAHLADRVFQASVGMLPSQIAAVDAPLKLTATATSTSRQPLEVYRLFWGRAAMAASLAFACVLAAWLMRGSNVHTSNVVARNRDVTPEIIARALEPVHSSVAARYEARLGYLLETNDLTAEDATSDLALLVSR